MNKTIKNSLLLLLLSTSITKTNDFENGAKFVGAGALAGAALFGIVKFADWATTESCDSLYKKALNQITSSKNQFSKGVEVSKSYFDQESKLHNLYTISKNYSHYTFEYLNRLNETIKSLNEMSNTLRKRVTKSSNKNNPDYIKLNSILNELNTHLVELQNLAKLLNGNKAYFNLSDTYVQCESRYRQERSYLTHLNVIQRALTKFSSYNYPLIAYEKEIASDINSLESEIRNANYEYNSLIGYANNLLHEMQNIHSLISTSKEFYAEKIKQEIDRKEAERIAIEKRKAEEIIEAERRKAAAQERQARAMEQQAQAERQKARAMEYQNQVEREKAKAQMADAKARKKAAKVRQRELDAARYYPNSQPSNPPFNFNVNINR